MIDSISTFTVLINFIVLFSGSIFSLVILVNIYDFQGRLSEEELMRTFNCGLGGVLICEKDKVGDVMTQMSALGEESYRIGEVVICPGEKFQILGNKHHTCISRTDM